VSYDDLRIIILILKDVGSPDVTRSTKATSSIDTDQPTPRQQVIAPAIASSIAQVAPAQGGRKLEETREENQIQIKAFYEKQQYGNVSSPIRTSEIATQRLALPMQGSFEEGRSSIQKTITNTTRSAPRMHNDRQTSIHAAHASGAATSPRKSSGDPVQSVSSYNQTSPRAQSSYNQNYPSAHSKISDNSPRGVKSQYEAFARQPSIDDAHASEAAPAPDVSISNKSQYQTFLKMFGSGQETRDNWQEARAAVATIAASSRTQINSLQVAVLFKSAHFIISIVLLALLIYHALNTFQSTSSHVQGQSIRSASTLQHNGQERGIGTVASTGGSGYRSTTTQPWPNEMGSSISCSRTHQPTYFPPQTRAQREFDHLSGTFIKLCNVGINFQFLFVICCDFKYCETYLDF